MVEILCSWPKTRGTDKSPFFVDASDGELVKKKKFRLAGTFRNGIVSPMAVPTGLPEQWYDYMSLDNAVKAAEHLNRLHGEGKIDWKPIYPVIIGR